MQTRAQPQRGSGARPTRGSARAVEAPRADAPVPTCQSSAVHAGRPSPTLPMGSPCSRAPEKQANWEYSAASSAGPGIHWTSATWPSAPPPADSLTSARSGARLRCALRSASQSRIRPPPSPAARHGAQQRQVARGPARAEAQRGDGRRAGLGGSGARGRHGRAGQQVHQLHAARVHDGHGRTAREGQQPRRGAVQRGPAPRHGARHCAGCGVRHHGCSGSRSPKVKFRSMTSFRPARSPAAPYGIRLCDIDRLHSAPQGFMPTA